MIGKPPHDRGDVHLRFANGRDAVCRQDAAGPGVVGGQRLLDVAAEAVELLAQVTRAAFEVGERIVGIDAHLARGAGHELREPARELGVDPDDPFANLEGGARYLREQLDRFDGDLEKALAAYNAGPGRVERANGIPNIRETQTYVAAVMGRLASHTRSDN